LHLAHPPDYSLQKNSPHRRTPGSRSHTLSPLSQSIHRCANRPGTVTHPDRGPVQTLLEPWSYWSIAKGMSQDGTDSRRFPHRVQPIVGGTSRLQKSCLVSPPRRHHEPAWRTLFVAPQKDLQPLLKRTEASLSD